MGKKITFIIYDECLAVIKRHAKSQKASAADVIRNAIAAYDFVMTKQSEGKILFYRDPVTKEDIRIDF